MIRFLKLALICAGLAATAPGCSTSQSRPLPAAPEPGRMTAYDVAAIVARQSNPAPVAMSSGDGPGRQLFTQDATTQLATGPQTVQTADLGQD